MNCREATANVASFCYYTVFFVTTHELWKKAKNPLVHSVVAIARENYIKTRSHPNFQGKDRKA